VSNLMAEVASFRRWAEDYPSKWSGEWECDYQEWGRLYEAVLEFISTHRIEEWSSDESSAILYAVARDNETEHLSGEIRCRHPKSLVALASEALDAGEPAAKWQLADGLGQLGSSSEEVENLLKRFAHDENEYVRRRSLQSLARLQAPATEDLAMTEWDRPDPDQQWSRMGVLWCLHRIGSPYLEAKLVEAENDVRPHLSGFARRVRLGRIDD
jgi:hypothetical protein